MNVVPGALLLWALNRFSVWQTTLWRQILDHRHISESFPLGKNTLLLVFGHLFHSRPKRLTFSSSIPSDILINKNICAWEYAILNKLLRKFDRTNSFLQTPLLLVPDNLL